MHDYKNIIVLLTGFAGSGKYTVGKALSKKTHSKFVPSDLWMAPVLQLLGNDATVMWDLTDQGWVKLNEARDVILSTIADVCSSDSSFIITFEMIDQDPYHKIFYEKVVDVVKKRNAYFLPVRLICDEEELLSRVQSEDRKQYFKTSDVELMRRRSREKQVFYTGHKNEITINNTEKSPEEVAEMIIKQIDVITTGG